MATFSIRPAVFQDSAAIRVLVISGQINPTALDWRRFCVAVTEEGDVIGCGQIKPHRDGSQELASIAVREAWRGRGVARALIEALLASHSGPLYLMCRSGLGEMYQKFGFRALSEEEMPEYFRWVRKVAGVVEALRKRDEVLLVMGWGL